MSASPYLNTVSPLLLKILKILMNATELKDFRLVGGTALSIYRGHRLSEDIDLFTDAPYGSVNFEAIDLFIRRKFSYVDAGESQTLGPGRSYFVGNSADECVKLDIFYTDTFIREEIVIQGIRLADPEDIIAMKIELICRDGRKKDFWDIHELKNDYSIEKMISLYMERYPYGCDRNKIVNSLTDFKKADEDFDPICLKGKYWELIKLDFIDIADQIKNHMQ